MSSPPRDNRPAPASGVLQGAGKELSGFKKFILRGNVVDLESPSPEVEEAMRRAAAPSGAQLADEAATAVAERLRASDRQEPRA
jgi:hypothetical protein